MCCVLCDGRSFVGIRCGAADVRGACRVGKVRHAVELAGALAAQHRLSVTVPAGEELPEELQERLRSQLQQRHTAAAAELEEGRRGQRAAQQSMQQRLSGVEAKLASFQADVAATSDSQAAIQRVSPPDACLALLPAPPLPHTCWPAALARCTPALPVRMLLRG